MTARKKKAWEPAHCLKCRRKLCSSACRYLPFMEDYLLAEAIKAAKEKYVFLSPQDDPELVSALRASRDHDVVPVMSLQDLDPRVKRALVRSGLTLVAVEEPGAEIEESLPAGIFPQTSAETIEDALWRRGLPYTNLHATLDYGSGMTEMGWQVPEDALLDPLHPKSVYREPVPRFTTRVNGQDRELPGWPPMPSAEAEAANAERVRRFDNITLFLRIIRSALRLELGPPIVKTQRGWRFVHTNEWASKWLNIRLWRPIKDKAAFIEAAWAFVWYHRRRWLNAQVYEADVTVVNLVSDAIHPGTGYRVRIFQQAKACSIHRKPIWLSEPHLAAVREAFRKLLKECNLPLSTLRMREERKVISNLQRLQARLAHLEELENKGFRHLKKLQEEGALTPERAEAASRFFDRVAEDKARTQAELDFVALKEAQEFYDEKFLGYRLMDAEHDDDQRAELLAEIFGIYC